MMGYDVGKCRSPFNLVPEKGLEAIRNFIEENPELK